MARKAAPKPADARANGPAGPAEAQAAAAAAAAAQTGLAPVQSAGPQGAGGHPPGEGDPSSRPGGPTPPTPPPVAERRAATAWSRIDHDGRIYPAGEVLALTRAAFAPLARAGALVERDWDACTAVP